MHKLLFPEFIVSSDTNVIRDWILGGGRAAWPSSSSAHCLRHLHFIPFFSAFFTAFLSVAVHYCCPPHCLPALAAAMRPLHRYILLSRAICGDKKKRGVTGIKHSRYRKDFFKRKSKWWWRLRWIWGRKEWRVLSKMIVKTIQQYQSVGRVIYKILLVQGWYEVWGREMNNIQNYNLSC